MMEEQNKRENQQSHLLLTVTTDAGNHYTIQPHEEQRKNRGRAIQFVRVLNEIGDRHLNKFLIFSIFCFIIGMCSFPIILHNQEETTTKPQEVSSNDDKILIPISDSPYRVENLPGIFTVTNCTPSGNCYIYSGRESIQDLIKVVYACLSKCSTSFLLMRN